MVRRIIEALGRPGVRSTLLLAALATVLMGLSGESRNKSTDGVITSTPAGVVALDAPTVYLNFLEDPMPCGGGDWEFFIDLDVQLRNDGAADLVMDEPVEVLIDGVVHDGAVGLDVREFLGSAAGSRTLPAGETRYLVITIDDLADGQFETIDEISVTVGTLQLEFSGLLLVPET